MYHSTENHLWKTKRRNGNKLPERKRKIQEKIRLNCRVIWRKTQTVDRKTWGINAEFKRWVLNSGWRSKDLD